MPSINAKRVAERVLETVRKGQKVSVSKIAREEGYSPEYAKQPGRITSQPAFRAVMEKAGLDDAFLSKRARQLVNAEDLQKLDFSHDEFDPLTFTDEDLQDLVKSIPAFRFIRIVQGKRFRRVYFAAPDRLTQKAMLELMLRAKNHLKDQGPSLTLNQFNQTNIISEEHRQAVDAIFDDGNTPPKSP